MKSQTKPGQRWSRVTQRAARRSSRIWRHARFERFAKHRLGARPLEETDLGLSYRDRGTTVHKALEIIWLELGSHARLLELNPTDLQALIARGADAAVAKLGPGIGRDLEKHRLQRLLSEWLDHREVAFGIHSAGH